MAKYREDDINLLLPSWRVQVQALLDRMKALGFVPVLFDGLRTAEEAKANALKHTGKADSMHCYGCAADLICAEHGWSCQANKCKFFTTLGREAEAAGMTWGGRFHIGIHGFPDMPHVQGIPIKAQQRMRNIGMDPEKADARDALVREFAKVKP